MKNKTLTLSIVIPVHNEQRYLKACLDSIAKQTVMPDEVIVVNNNSFDKTAQIAKTYKFVRLIDEKRQGIVYARNTGFNIVKSDLIGRIDADTHLSKDWVEQVLAFFESQPQTSAVTGNCYFYDFPFRRSFNALHTFIYYVLQKRIAGTNILWGSNMVIRRADWLAVKKYCTLSNSVDEDIDLSLILYRHGFKVGRSNVLRAEVSLRRGDLGARNLNEYIGSWSRTYTNQKMYVRAFFIFVLAFLTILSAVVISPFTFLFDQSEKPKY